MPMKPKKFKDSPLVLYQITRPFKIDANPWGVFTMAWKNIQNTLKLEIEFLIRILNISIWA